MLGPIDLSVLLLRAASDAKTRYAYEKVFINSLSRNSLLQAPKSLAEEVLIVNRSTLMSKRKMMRGYRKKTESNVVVQMTHFVNALHLNHRQK